MESTWEKNHEGQGNEEAKRTRIAPDPDYEDKNKNW